MLVLSRRPGEEIIIAGNIRISIVEVHGERVRIGITAPANVRVDRAEIQERRTHCDRPALVPALMEKPQLALAH